MTACACHPGTVENGWQETRCDECVAVERAAWSGITERAQRVAAKLRASQCVVCKVSVRASERKYSGPCSTCGVMTCPAHTHFYVDESNRAINDAALPKCPEHVEVWR